MITYIATADVATIVVFRQCYASHFGPPNDETFASHPLAGRGFVPTAPLKCRSPHGFATSRCAIVATHVMIHSCFSSCDAGSGPFMTRSWSVPP